MSNLKEKFLLVCALWVNLSFKSPINYSMTKLYITSLKYLFDPEGGELPTLVKSNMTNTPMGPKSLLRDYHSVTVSLIRQPNLQICH